MQVKATRNVSGEGGAEPVNSRDTRSHAPHLSYRHPIAAVAARHCAGHLGNLRHRQAGGTACGACWERAIRDDERVVVLFDLPREVSPDPLYVDEIAVEKALRGESVSLTSVERAVVLNHLSAVRERDAKRAVPWDALRRLSRSGVDWKGRAKVPAARDGRVA